MITFDTESIRIWITAFFVLAGLAAVLAVTGTALLLPRRAARPAPETPVAPVAHRERVLEAAGARR